MGVVAVAFFAAPQVISSGTLNTTTGASTGAAPTSIAIPSGSDSITGTFPVTISYQNLPAGYSVSIAICASGVTSACTSIPPMIVSHSFSGSITVDLQSGQTLLIYTGATDAQYQVTVPYSFLDSIYFVIIAVVGLVLAVVGIALKTPSEKEDEESTHPGTRDDEPESPPNAPAPPGSVEGDWTK